IPGIKRNVKSVQVMGFSTAIVPLTRSQVVLPQRSDKHEVNVAIRWRQQIHYLRMCKTWLKLSVRPAQQCSLARW
ncbi:hypothetical protein EK468_24610, partial [Citrobacter braakii]|nr:hypothetical protein [Citrobacter braakii]